ncbi:Lrp/AsnC family transcriptional regulator [uncultured Bifidobacterium sp.]|uniref:Lrp/AsnC family transcriptional regulator n=1 Tax=uncultured Bifidobacterium sp. TaxID=165187 RepID=UPI00262B1741|nr:Lrp/AsnC family transcriptional regulator [uncultured Bifidobacterium sp.]
MPTEQTHDESRRNDTGPHALLDDINKVIIKQLQENGRRSYVSIGKSVGLSEAAVRSRVQRLTEAGIIQIVAVTNPLQLGFTRQAMIGVTIGGSANLDEILDHLKSVYNIDYIVVTAGRFDLLLEVFSSSDDELLSVVTTIRAIDGVLRTEIFTYLTLASQRYDFGVR